MIYYWRLLMGRCRLQGLQWRCLTESDCSSSFHGTNVLINGFLEIARPGKSNPRPERPLCVNTFIYTSNVYIYIYIYIYIHTRYIIVLSPSLMFIYTEL